MGAFTKLHVETSTPTPISAKDSFAQHTTHTKDECPTSTHRRKVHMARATTRQTVTTTWGNGQKTRSYIDACTCQFCGHTWQQEWCTAGF